MKKALMVGPVPPPRGGIASMMEDIVHSSLKDHYAFDVFSRPFRFPPHATDPIRRNLIRARKYAKFWKQCISGHYCFMHIHSPGHRFFQSAVYMLLARLSGLRVLLHLHGNDWDQFYVQASRLRQYFLRRGLALSTRIVVLQRVWAEEINKLGIAAHASVLPNMIPDIEPCEPAVIEETRKRFDLKPDDYVIFLAGAGVVGKNKGIFDLLNAVPPIAERHDSVRFVIAGGDEKAGQTAQAMEIIEANGLHKWIRILGDIEREQVYVLMEIAYVYLLPSYIEGMPISIMEAMRSHATVIATPVGAVPEMIEHERSGLLIDRAAPDQIVEAVLRLIDDEQLRHRLTERARQVFEEKFLLETGVMKLRDLYEEIQ